MKISNPIRDSILNIQMDDFRTLRVEMFDKFKLRWQLSIALIALSASIFPFLMEADDNIRLLSLITIPFLFYVFIWLSASLWYQAMNMGIYIDKYIRPNIIKMMGLSKAKYESNNITILGWEEHLNTVKRSAMNKAVIIVVKRLPEYVPFLIIAIGSLIIFFLSGSDDKLLFNIAIAEAAIFPLLLAGLIYFIYITEKYWIEKTGNET